MSIMAEFRMWRWKDQEFKVMNSLAGVLGYLQFEVSLVV